MRRLINRTVVVTLLVLVAALLPRLYKLGSFLTIDEVKWAEGAAQFLMGLSSGSLFQTYWHFFPGITISWGSAVALWGLCVPAPDLAACVHARVENLAETIGWLRLSPVILTSVAVVGVYILGRKLLGDKLALLTSLLLAFDPFFIAHSRLLNGDAVAAVLMFLSLLAFLIYWRNGSTSSEFKEQKRVNSHSSSIIHHTCTARRRKCSSFTRWLILSGVLAGLALLTKLPAPLIGVFVGGLGVAALVRDWRTEGVQAARRWLIALVVWGGLALLTFVVFWPAMWTAPLETLRLMYVDAFEVGGAGEGHATFFWGQILSDPGPWFYPYVIAFRLTPVVMMGLLFAVVWLASLTVRWQVADGRSQVAGSRKPTLHGITTVLVMLAYIVVIILFANASPKKLDRYVMAVVPALILLAAIGLDYGIRVAYSVFHKVKGRRNTVLHRNIYVTRENGEGRKGGGTPPKPPGLRRVMQYAVANNYYLLVLTILASLQLFFAVLATPYYLTYYNPVLGSVSRIVTRAPVGWGEGLERAAMYLNDLPNAESLKVSSWYSDIFQPYFVGQRASFADDGRAQLAADYVVFYVNQIQRQKPYPGLVDYFRAGQPEFVVAVKPNGQIVNRFAGTNSNNEVSWVEVYKAPAAQAAGGAPKIEGVAQLLAYKVAGSKAVGSDDPMNVSDRLLSDEIEVTLYLRVLGDMPAETRFNIGLVQNSKWGSLKSDKIKGDWLAGKIVEWRGVLTLPPDMPSGDYRLWVSLETQGKVSVGEFSISEKDPLLTIK